MRFLTGNWEARRIDGKGWVLKGKEGQPPGVGHRTKHYGNVFHMKTYDEGGARDPACLVSSSQKPLRPPDQGSMVFRNMLQRTVP